MAWENAAPPPANQMDPNERFYGSLLCAFFLIFFTFITAMMFMQGHSPAWGWAVGAGVTVVAYWKVLL